MLSHGIISSPLCQVISWNSFWLCSFIVLLPIFASLDNMYGLTTQGDEPGVLVIQAMDGWMHANVLNSSFNMFHDNTVDITKLPYALSTWMTSMPPVRLNLLHR